MARPRARKSLSLTGLFGTPTAQKSELMEERLRQWYPGLTNDVLAAWNVGAKARYRSEEHVTALRVADMIMAYLNMDVGGPHLVMRKPAEYAVRVDQLEITDEGRLAVGRLRFAPRHTWDSEWVAVSSKTVLEISNADEHEESSDEEDRKPPLPHERIDTLKVMAWRACVQVWHRMKPPARRIVNKLLSDRATRTATKKRATSDRGLVDGKPMKRVKKDQ